MTLYRKILEVTALDHITVTTTNTNIHTSSDTVAVCDTKNICGLTLSTSVPRNSPFNPQKWLYIELYPHQDPSSALSPYQCPSSTLSLLQCPSVTLTPPQYLYLNIHQQHSLHTSIYH